MEIIELDIDAEFGAATDASRGPQDRNRRSPKEERQLLDRLQSNGGKWIVWSTHASLPSARARRSQVQNAQKFASLPLIWRAMNVTLDGDTEQTPCLMVRWKGGAERTVLDTKALTKEQTRDLLLAMQTGSEVVLPDSALSQKIISVTN